MINDVDDDLIQNYFLIKSNTQTQNQDRDEEEFTARFVAIETRAHTQKKR
jgi:site-specific DNA-adenine methylase